MINHRRDRGKVGQAEPYPVHTLKRVDRPTTQIDDDQVPRVDEREAGFNRAGRGDLVGICELPPYAVYSHGAVSSRLGSAVIHFRHATPLFVELGHFIKP